MKAKKAQTRRLAVHYGVDLDVVPFEDWHYGVNAELEHGRKYGKIANVINDNLHKAARIAIGHLLEFPDYYKRLRKMEDRAEDYWYGRRKPKVLLKKQPASR